MLLQTKKRKLGLLEDDDADITDLAEQVSTKAKEFGVKKPVITNTPGMKFTVLPFSYCSKAFLDVVFLIRLDVLGKFREGFLQGVG